MLIELGHPRWFDLSLVPDVRSRAGGYSLLLIIAPWPADEQEPGYLIRALANIEITWSRRRGLQCRRYCPNRAEYWLFRNMVEGER